MDQADADWLRDRLVLVIVAGVDFAGDIVAGLAARGARVALLSDNTALLDAQAGRAVCFPTEFGARVATEERIGAVIDQLGVPDLVVLSATPSVAVETASIVDLSDDAWLGAVRQPIRQVIHILQALQPHLLPKGGAVAVVAPSLSLAGARSLVPLTTLLEGQRGLMKSVARQWGKAGVTLNWLALAPRALSPVFAEAPLATKGDAVPVALGRAPDTAREIVPVLGFLGSPAGRVMTGATLTLDGGEWMVP